MWNDAKDFKEKLDNKNVTSFPCYKKNFGLECPYCNEARQFFADGEDEQGKKKYAKKQVWCFALIVSGAEQYNKKVVLLNLPVKIVDSILDKVFATDADIRWSPVPSNIKDGGLLVLSKKKEDQFPSYSIDYISKPFNSEQQFNKTFANQKPNIRDVSTLSRLLFCDSGNLDIFLPSKNMQDKDVLKFKLLPNPYDIHSVPFGLLYVHYIDALSLEDKKMINCKFDINKFKSQNASINSIDDDILENEPF